MGDMILISLYPDDGQPKKMGIEYCVPHFYCSQSRVSAEWTLSHWLFSFSSSASPAFVSW